MSNPEPIITTKDVWVLVASSVKTGEIHRLSTKPTLYLFTYRIHDDPVPGPGIEDGAIYFQDSPSEILDYDEFVDIYILARGEDGIVRYDSLAGKKKIETVRQSNTSPWNDFYFVQSNGVPTTLTVAVPTSGDTRLLTVASIADISIGDWLGLFSGAPGIEERYYWAEVEDINGLVLTMDTLIDFTFAVGSVVLSTTRNMAVDGSVTHQVFSIQAGGGAGDLEIDISRVMLGSLTNDTVNLGKFADIAGGLARPFYLRVKENGTYRNKIAAKTNFNLALFAYDWQPFASINPQEGQDGFVWRFSIGGEDKHDAVSRVSGGNIGSLEWIVQSNLSTIVVLESVGANSEVTP